jgi:type III pantothenate kinase
MILELDAGNTRIKWRLRAATEQRTRYAGVVVAAAEVSATVAALALQFQVFASEQPERVLVSNVRGDSFRLAFAHWCETAYSLTPEFACATQQCAGVSSGYLEPSKLGVDRWLAMLAAYNAAKSACCVLDCGTTITVDVITNAGEHLGGYIVPGLVMMRSALMAKSTALQHADVEWGSALGRTTAEAIQHGVLQMVVGLAQQVERTAAVRGESLIWYVTGGDAELLQKFLPQKTILAESLVLDGLSLACQRNEGGQ